MYFIFLVSKSVKKRRMKSRNLDQVPSASTSKQIILKLIILLSIVIKLSRQQQFDILKKLTIKTYKKGFLAPLPEFSPNNPKEGQKSAKSRPPTLLDTQVYKGSLRTVLPIQKPEIEMLFNIKILNGTQASKRNLHLIMGLDNSINKQRSKTTVKIVYNRQKPEENELVLFSEMRSYALDEELGLLPKEASDLIIERFHIIYRVRLSEINYGNQFYVVDIHEAKIQYSGPAEPELTHLIELGENNFFKINQRGKIITAALILFVILNYIMEGIKAELSRNFPLKNWKFFVGFHVYNLLVPVAVVSLGANLSLTHFIFGCMFFFLTKVTQGLFLCRSVKKLIIDQMGAKEGLKKTFLLIFCQKLNFVKVVIMVLWVCLCFQNGLHILRINLVHTVLCTLDVFDLKDYALQNKRGIKPFMFVFVSTLSAMQVFHGLYFCAGFLLFLENPIGVWEYLVPDLLALSTFFVILHTKYKWRTHKVRLRDKKMKNPLNLPPVKTDKIFPVFSKLAYLSAKIDSQSYHVPPSWEMLEGIDSLRDYKLQMQQIYFTYFHSPRHNTNLRICKMKGKCHILGFSNALKPAGEEWSEQGDLKHFFPRPSRKESIRRPDEEDPDPLMLKLCFRFRERDMEEEVEGIFRVYHNNELKPGLMAMHWKYGNQSVVLFNHRQKKFLFTNKIRPVHDIDDTADRAMVLLPDGSFRLYYVWKRSIRIIRSRIEVYKKPNKSLGKNYHSAFISNDIEMEGSNLEEVFLRGSEGRVLAEKRFCLYDDLIAVLYVYIDQVDLDKDHPDETKFQNIYIAKISSRRDIRNAPASKEYLFYEIVTDRCQFVTSLEKVTEGVFSACKIDKIFFFDSKHLCMILRDRIALVDWSAKTVRKLFEIDNLFRYCGADPVVIKKYFAQWWYIPTDGRIYFYLGRRYEEEWARDRDPNRFLQLPGKTRVRFHIPGYISDVFLRHCKEEEQVDKEFIDFCVPDTTVRRGLEGDGEGVLDSGMEMGDLESERRRMNVSRQSCVERRRPVLALSRFSSVIKEDSDMG